MDVRPTGDRRRVAEVERSFLDRSDDVPHRGARILGSTSRPQRSVREDGPGPRPEVLGCDVRPRDLAEVLVDVLRPDVMDLPVPADVREQLLTRQLLASPDDRRQPAVPEPDFVPLTRLPTKSEADRRALDAHVAAAKRRQPERPIEPRVLFVADPDACRLQQPDHRGKDLLAGHPRAGEVGVAPAADPRQDAPEFDETLVLRLVPARTPAFVIPVLLSSPSVPAGRLEVAVWVRADPHLGPRRRDRKRADPAENGGVVDRPPLDVPVREATTG